MYRKATDGKTKNDHFADLLDAARGRGLAPKAVLFGGWYASVENPKKVRGFGWVFVTRLPSNRKVRIDHGLATAVSARPIAASGTDVWLPGYGLVTVFGVVAPDGDIAYWATNDLAMTALTRRQFAEFSWAIEYYHRGIKPCTGVERCQCRSAVAQRNHIGLALRAFLRLEIHGFAAGVRWVEAKTAILRDAVRDYLEQPRYRLPKPATA